MRTIGASLTITFLLVLAFNAEAQSTAPADGTIVEQASCEPPRMATYEQYVEARRRSFASEVAAARREGFRMEMAKDFTAVSMTKDEFARRKAYAGFECQRIKYLSDGLKVVGFIWKPTATAGKKLPLIIFARGGNREFGKLTPWMQFGFYDYVANGFVVIGSQYRGNDGGEGKEEFGGADVRDLLNVIPLAKALGYVDMDNVFLFGWSRGGMMSFLALKHQLPVNAAAVGGALADLISQKAQRPEMVETVYKRLIPDFDARGDALMRERSAVYWPEKIAVPLLILQGGADWRVDTGTNALALAHKLHALGKTYELIVYAGDDHGLFFNGADGNRRTIAWFRRYMK